MQEKKKRNRILMLLIAGMLLIYAFTDTENVKAATESLKQEFYKLSEKLYQQAQAAQGEAAQGGDSDVVDGDGKEI